MIKRKTKAFFPALFATGGGVRKGQAKQKHAVPSV